MTPIIGDRLGGATSTIIPGIDTDKGAAPRTVGTSAVVPQTARDATGQATIGAETGIGGALG